MSTEPEALRVAEILKSRAAMTTDQRAHAAFQLRKQHVEIERLREALEGLTDYDRGWQAGRDDAWQAYQNLYKHSEAENEQHAEIERLREANEALRRDAERWQWVRVWFRREFEGRNGDFGGTLEDFDAAIDAAMGGKP